MVDLLAPFPSVPRIFLVPAACDEGKCQHDFTGFDLNTSASRDFPHSTNGGLYLTFTPGLPVIAPSTFRATPSILSTIPGVRFWVTGVFVFFMVRPPTVFLTGVFLGVAVVFVVRGFAAGLDTAFLTDVTSEGLVAGRPPDRVVTGMIYVLITSFSLMKLVISGCAVAFILTYAGCWKARFWWTRRSGC